MKYPSADGFRVFELKAPLHGKNRALHENAQTHNARYNTDIGLTGRVMRPTKGRNVRANQNTAKMHAGKSHVPTSVRIRTPLVRIRRLKRMAVPFVTSIFSIVLRGHLTHSVCY